MNRMLLAMGQSVMAIEEYATHLECTFQILK